MPNELIFLVHALFIATATAVASAWSATALTVLVSLLCVLMNLLVTKQIVLFGLTVTCTDALTVGATLSLNLLQEYWGQAKAQRAIYVSFAAALVTVVLTQLHLLYAPSAVDTMHTHAAALFGFMPRIMTASLFSYFLAQQIDYRLYGWLRRGRQSRGLGWRNAASISVSQLADTVIFSFAGLYGIVENVSDIIIVSYAIKLCVIAASVPLVVALAPLVRRAANVASPKPH